jgi:hypothetical protein
MARLSDATRVTEELGQLVRRLHEEVAGGRSDLVRLVALADEVAARADSLASTFIAIDQELGRLGQPNGGSRTEGQGRAGAREATRERDRAPSRRQPKRPGTKRQAQRGGAGGRPSSARRAEPAEEPTKSDLLAQASEAAIPGRSSMSKEELAQAVEAQEQQTKDELVEQARALDIPGRSEMSKQELLEALRTEASVSREELLDRAKDAEIPGRSEMSKEELREALQSTSARSSQT